MSVKALHWFILIVAFMMLVSGIWFVAHPLASFVSFTSLIEGILLLAGLCFLVNYMRDKHEEQATRWILAEGCVTFLVGAILLMTRDSDTQSLVTTFGLWVLFSGVIHITASLKARDYGVSGWGWMLAISIVTILTGFFSLMNSSIGLISLGVTIGVYFIIQGLNAISTFYFMEHI